MIMRLTDFKSGTDLFFSFKILVDSNEKTEKDFNVDYI